MEEHRAVTTTENIKQKAWSNHAESPTYLLIFLLMWFSICPCCLSQFELGSYSLQLKAFLLANSDHMTISKLTLGPFLYINPS